MTILIDGIMINGKLFEMPPQEVWISDSGEITITISIAGKGVLQSTTYIRQEHLEQVAS